MTACISRTFMWHDLWDADHCPCVEREPNWAPQPELDASVKRVTSVSLVARGRPCRTAGDNHHATSDRTHCGTWIRSDQFPVLWHQVVVAHHWTGRRRTNEAMNTSMPRSLCRSLAVMFGLAIQCWWTDWTFTRIFRQGRHCETLSVELHPNELEVLTWCEIGLLEVDDPAKKLEDLDGCLGVQLSLFRCICSDQPVV